MGLKQISRQGIFLKTSRKAKTGNADSMGTTIKKDLQRSKEIVEDCV